MYIVGPQRFQTLSMAMTYSSRVHLRPQGRGEDGGLLLVDGIRRSQKQIWLEGADGKSVSGTVRTHVPLVLEVRGWHNLKFTPVSKESPKPGAYIFDCNLALLSRIAGEPIYRKIVGDDGTIFYVSCESIGTTGLRLALAGGGWRRALLSQRRYENHLPVELLGETA